MTQFFKRSLLFAAMTAMVAVAQTGTALAQVCPRIGFHGGVTRAFDGNRAAVDAIAEAAPNTAEAYYDPATGDVIVNVGAGISLLGFPGEFIIEENLNVSILGQGLDSLPLPVQAGPAGIGFWNPSGLITSLTPVFSQQAAGGPFNLGPLLPAGLGTPSDFDQFGFDSDPCSRLSAAHLSYGLVTGGVFRDGFQIISAVPEPGSLTFVVVAGLGFVARRRR